MKPKQLESINIIYYLDLVFKQRWLLITPFCLAMIVGIYLAVTLPPIFEANTMILVEPQRVSAADRNGRHQKSPRKNKLES